MATSSFNIGDLNSDIAALNGSITALDNKITNIETYKTTPYTGTTSSASVEIGSVSLPAGKYLVIECGSSNYPAYIYNGQVGHGWADNALSLTTTSTTVVALASGRSATVTWERYYVTFIKVG